MTLDEILNFDIKDINKLAKENPRELRKITSRINSIASKRVKRMEESELKTPPFSAFVKGGGVKSIRGQDISFVKSQFGKVKRFLESGQSTVTEARQFQKEVEERMGLGGLSAEQTKRFWEVYNKLKKRYPNFGAFIPSEEMIEFLVDQLFGYPNITIDELLNRASKLIDSEYERAEMVDLDGVGGGVGEFFD